MGTSGVPLWYRLCYDFLDRKSGVYDRRGRGDVWLARDGHSSLRV